VGGKSIKPLTHPSIIIIVVIIAIIIVRSCSTSLCWPTSNVRPCCGSRYAITRHSITLILSPLTTRHARAVSLKTLGGAEIVLAIKHALMKLMLAEGLPAEVTSLSFSSLFSLSFSLFLLLPSPLEDNSTAVRWRRALCCSPSERALCGRLRSGGFERETREIPESERRKREPRKLLSQRHGSSLDTGWIPCMRTDLSS
jgi:hypothetical protein